NLAGTAALGNGGDGIRVNSAAGVTVGGTAPGAGNLVSGNSEGIEILGNATGALVQGNTIGTNAAGTAALPNVFRGVILTNVPGATIGGTAPGADNLISGNGNGGVQITGAAATGNLIEGNLIGTDRT